MALSNEQAAPKSKIVFLTVRFGWQSQTLTNRKNHAREGQLLVECAVPLAAALSGNATRTLGVWQAARPSRPPRWFPTTPGASALHTVSAEMLCDLDLALDEDAIVCGKKDDKTPLFEPPNLIPGLRAVDGGLLENSRTTESLTVLLIGFHARDKTHAGIRITGLPTRPS